MRVAGKVVKAPPSVAKPAPAAEVRPNDPQVIEPTPDEERNGWTRETLTTYLIQRAAQQNQYATEHQTKAREVRTESAAGFDPHRWGR